MHHAVNTNNTVQNLGLHTKLIVDRFIGEALTADEKGDRMNALELYNKSLSIIRSGLAALQSSVGSADPQDPQLHELRGKLERYVQPAEPPTIFFLLKFH